MMSPVLQGLAQLWSPTALAGLGLGSLLGLAAGLMPGINGRVGLVMVTPIALTLGPAAGAVFLIAFHSVVHTSGSIPAILFGTPTSAAEAATAIDGYAMSQKGQGGRATGATVMASMLGGVLGAAFLFIAVGPALMVIRHLGSPEIAALSCLGLLSISFLSDGRPAAGLMSAGLGLLIGTVGIDPLTGADRFTFGALGLWDGASAAALVTGLFVVPELLIPNRLPGPDRPSRKGLHDVGAGAMEVFKHRLLVLRTALIGVVVGLIPGLGVSGAVWLAYGHARLTHPSNVPYGQGAISGVIAPEVANNAKEGGALVPTLFFGIPGSSGMAILLASLMALGIEPGPRLLEGQPDLIALLAWSNVMSNLIAAPVCLMLAPLMIRLARLPRDWVTPVAMATALTATALTAPGVLIWAQLAVFSALGIVLARSAVPRAPLLLGFVLGPGLEKTLMRSAEIQGWEALLRPGVLVVIVLIAALVIIGIRTRPAPGPIADPLPPQPLASTALAGLVAGLALIGATSLPQASGAAVVLAAAVALIGALAMRPWSSQGSALRPGPSKTALALFGTCLVGGAVNAPLAIGAYVAIALRMGPRVRWGSAIAAALVMGTVAWGLRRMVG